MSASGSASTDGFGSDADWLSFAASPDPQQESWRAPSTGVGPITALRLAWTRRDQFEGRASRSEYWWLYIWGYVWVIIVGTVSVVLSLASPKLGSYVFIGFFIATIGLMVASIDPLRAVQRRRLHDTGRDGKWRWTWGLIPGVDIWALARRGDSGDNRYGPGPASS